MREFDPDYTGFNLIGSSTLSIRLTPNCRNGVVVLVAVRVFDRIGCFRLGGWIIQT